MYDFTQGKREVDREREGGGRVSGGEKMIKSNLIRGVYQSNLPVRALNFIADSIKMVVKVNSKLCSWLTRPRRLWDEAMAIPNDRFYI